MQIPVQVSKDGLKEWMMVELQGELRCLPHITMGGRLLGDLLFNKQILLKFSAIFRSINGFENFSIISVEIKNTHFLYSQGVPVLLIGHHILHGAVQDLSKPVAVMKKVGDREGPEAHYSVTAVVHKKVLFKNRPKPIVNAGAPRLI
ncbi:hypothetical protein O3P69_000125 [Scylla paramamosain]|uniref:Chromosome transmission fidelity protein 8 n=1 Tax=Scylla paramamosain TaxID=85552 RepID=A0AAW0UVU2_SCYPA